MGATVIISFDVGRLAGILLVNVAQNQAKWPEMICPKVIAQVGSEAGSKASNLFASLNPPFRPPQSSTASELCPVLNPPQ